MSMSGLFNGLKKLSLPQRIVIGLILGTLFGLFTPQATWIGTLGTLFVGALKSIAPLLVFMLVMFFIYCMSR